MGTGLQAAVDADFGLKAALEETRIDAAEMAEGKRHACTMCFEGKAGPYVEVKGRLSLRLTGGKKKDLGKVKIIDKEFTDNCYLSLMNEETSVHGGKPCFGYGECPNYQYRLTVETYEDPLVRLEGIPCLVVRTNPGLSQYFEGDSTLSLFLYPGNYDVSAWYSPENMKFLPVRIKDTKLKELYCYDNNLTSLNVSGCSTLEGLACGGNQLTTLDVRSCKHLTGINCANNRLTSLYVTGLDKLDCITCTNNLLSVLDVGGCTFLCLTEEDYDPGVVILNYHGWPHD